MDTSYIKYQRSNRSTSYPSNKKLSCCCDSRSYWIYDVCTL